MQKWEKKPKLGFLVLVKHGLKRGGGGSKYLIFWSPNRENRREGEKRRGEEKKKRRGGKEGQKGMELYGISKVLNGFPYNCMVISCPQT